MNDPQVFENPCAICRKRITTKYCDFVIKYNNYTYFVRNFKDSVEMNSRDDNETCDLPLCEDCAHHVGADSDLCPYHYKLYKQAELPDELKGEQRRAKAMIVRQTMEEEKARGE